MHVPYLSSSLQVIENEAPFVAKEAVTTGNASMRAGIRYGRRAQSGGSSRLDEMWQSQKANCGAPTKSRQAEYSERLIFSLRILFCSVVLLRPRRSAAPPLPAILPDESFRASRIACRSACSNVDAAMTTLLAEDLLSSVRGTFNSSPCVRITQRSMKFSSSRMFPGQSAFTKASMAGLGTDRIRFCMRRERRDTKKWTSS